MKYKFKTIPYKYQLKAIKKTISQPNTALLLDPGLGKTKISIDNLGIRNIRDNTKRIIVLAPKVVTGVWVDEIMTHLPDDISRSVHLIQGTRLEKEEQIKEAEYVSKHHSGLTFVISNYETFSVHRGNGKNKSLIDAAKKFNPETSIADESQYIKTHNSARSKAAYQIAKLAEHRLILTGTMITRSPLDVFGQYRFLDDNIFGGNFSQFKRRYAIMGGYGGYQVVGWRNLEEMRELIHQVAIRLRKEDCLDLPEKTIIKVPVELSSKNKKAYNEMKNQMLTEIGDKVFTTELAIVKALRLHQLAGGFISQYDEEIEDKLIADVGSDKLDATIELTEMKLYYGSKVVIYCRFIHEIEKLKEGLEKKKINVLTIQGSTKDVPKNIKMFQEDPNYSVIIIQVSKGIGITLTAADVAIFHSLSPRYDDFVQNQDRIHRIGQLSSTTTYYIMLAKDTIDFHMYSSILAKKDFSDYIQDNKHIIFE